MTVDYNSTNANSSPPKQSLEGVFLAKKDKIRTNLPRRAMLAVSKSRSGSRSKPPNQRRAVLWIVSFGLMVFCLWQGVKWWRLNADIRDSSTRSDIDHQLESLRQEIGEKEYHLAFLEEKAFPNSSGELVSWVTAQVEQSDIPRIGAKVAKTEIIGVENLKKRKVELYYYAPVKFTLRGDYHSFGRLINRLERSQYPLKLDYLSIASRRNAPEEQIMDIVLCKVSKIGKPITKVRKKEKHPTIFVVPQRKLADEQSEGEQQFKPIGADFVYPNHDGMRDIFQPHHPKVTPQKKSGPPSLSLILTGVIYDEQTPLAILVDRHNKSYLAGVDDTILDFTVLKIESGSIILNREGTQIELKVFKDKEIFKTF